MRSAVVIAIMLAFITALSSCCRKPLVSSNQSDSTRIEYRDRYRERVMRDTAYVRDSIYVRDRGDTVIMYHDRYHYVDRFLYDTVRITDTIFQAVYKDKVMIDVQRHVPMPYRVSMVVALIAMVCLVLWIYRRVKRM